MGKGGKRIIHFVFIIAQIGSKAIIAPATWFLLAMLKVKLFRLYLKVHFVVVSNIKITG